MRIRYNILATRTFKDLQEPSGTFRSVRMASHMFGEYNQEKEDCLSYTERLQQYFQAIEIQPEKQTGWSVEYVIHLYSNECWQKLTSPLIKHSPCAKLLKLWKGILKISKPAKLRKTLSKRVPSRMLCVMGVQNRGISRKPARTNRDRLQEKGVR